MLSRTAQPWAGGRVRASCCTPLQAVSAPPYAPHAHQPLTPRTNSPPATHPRCVNITIPAFDVKLPSLPSASFKANLTAISVLPKVRARARGPSLALQGPRARLASCACLPAALISRPCPPPMPLHLLNHPSQPPKTAPHAAPLRREPGGQHQRHGHLPVPQEPQDRLQGLPRRHRRALPLPRLHGEDNPRGVLWEGGSLGALTCAFAHLERAPPGQLTLCWPSRG